MSSFFAPPLFSEVALPRSDLRLQLMSCPGVRFAASGPTASLAFLENDLGRMDAAGTRLVLSCLGEDELKLGEDRYAEAYRDRGVVWRLVPIPDMNAPTPELDPAIDAAFAEAAEIMARGGGFAIHCLAGLGRTGVVAARFAMGLGLSARDAITLIRSEHDPRAIETEGQEAYLIARDASPSGSGSGAPAANCPKRT